VKALAVCYRSCSEVMAGTRETMINRHGAALRTDSDDASPITAYISLLLYNILCTTDTPEATYVTRATKSRHPLLVITSEQIYQL
jgi:hypothetical protein